MTISAAETTATSDAYTTTTGTKEADMTTEMITTATSTGQTTTTAAPETETTTDIMTTITSEAETTTAAAEAGPTFRIIASGGSADGAPLQGPDTVEADVVMFNPPASEGFRPRTYILEPNTGRVKDQDNGRYLCGYYQGTDWVQSASIHACTGTPGPNQPVEYLNCEIFEGTLFCTLPQARCDQREIGMDLTCETSGNFIFPYFYLSAPGNQYILIGGTGLNLTPIELIAQEV
ncbi:hypothetical protein NW752_000085 [Fusarium irregulare]|uniref:Uncharacterized protein n=1 Tax=Fusarium irregulare TaxID=2494466 RepID=A0A9W8Q1N9_9HYPO|nr:hypothetical protein NW766_001752 [Fusarium irregulare]KAJ4027840.1 hypothetical protein NW752_000085 [Fusarium irregulare]